MVKRSLNGVMEHLRKGAAIQTIRGLSDRQLLERFIEARDEVSFTVLIERHGPMVLGVCRRALPGLQDAEDACQATFIVLARKAASVRKKTSLSSWLHGVAYRVATSLRRDQARRKNRERAVAAPAPKDPACEVTWREVQAILDEELQRLPERQRAPLILCYLECLTRDEAATQLGLSSGTLHGRLERARALLRARLTQRGLTFSAGITAVALGESVVRAALSPTVVSSSTKAAMLISTGQPLTQSIVAANVLALAKGVLNTMFLTKLKIGSAMLLCASLMLAVVGGFSASAIVAQDSKTKSPARQHTPPAAKTERDEDFIRRISRDLRETAPTPTEVYFFVASKDAGKRQKLIDLFIQERQAKKPSNLGGMMGFQGGILGMQGGLMGLQGGMMGLQGGMDMQVPGFPGAPGVFGQGMTGLPGGMGLQGGMLGLPGGMGLQGGMLGRAGMGMPAAQKTRETPAHVVSTNHLKQIGIAMQNYEATYGKLPPAAICDKNGKPLLSWRVALLPFIDQGNLYKQFRLYEPWDSEHNLALAQTLVKTYTHPQQPKDKPGTTHYRLFFGKEPMFDLRDGKSYVQITDGLSHTIMVVEAAEGVPWTKPDDFSYDTATPLPKFITYSEGGFNVLMGDGSVRFLSKSTSERVWQNFLAYLTL